MTDKAKWCSLCERYVVPKKHFNSIGWIGFVGTLSVLVASASISTLSQYTTTNAIAASLETGMGKIILNVTGMGNIILNVLLLLAAPFLLVSILYCVYYGLKKRHCPICNSSDLFDARPPEYREISTEMEDVSPERAPVPRRQTS